MKQCVLKAIALMVVIQGCAFAQSASQRPNILFALADDW